MARLALRYCLKKEVTMTFIRYIFIQIIAYGIDIGIFILSFKLGWLSPINANLLSKSAAGFFAFIAHKNFTFGVGHQSTHKKQVLSYIFLLVFNLFFCSLLLSLLIRWLSTPTLSKIFTDICSVVISFWLSKRFIFVSRAVTQDNCNQQDEASR